MPDQTQKNTDKNRPRQGGVEKKDDPRKWSHDPNKQGQPGGPKQGQDRYDDSGRMPDDDKNANRRP